MPTAAEFLDAPEVAANPRALAESYLDAPDVEPRKLAENYLDAPTWGERTQADLVSRDPMRVARGAESLGSSVSRLLNVGLQAQRELNANDVVDATDLPQDALGKLAQQATFAEQQRQGLSEGLQPGTEFTTALGEAGRRGVEVTGKAFGTLGALAKSAWGTQAFDVAGGREAVTDQIAATVENELARWGVKGAEAKPTPYEEGIAKLPVAARIGANIPYQIAGMTPKLAALAVLPQSLPAQMAGSAALFGLDDEGNFSLKEAGLMGLLPGASAVGRAAVGQSIAAGIRAGAGTLENPAVQKALMIGGDQAVMNAYMLAMDRKELAELHSKNPTAFWEEVGNIVGQNLAFGALHLRHESPVIADRGMMAARDEALLGTMPAGFIPKEAMVTPPRAVVPKPPVLAERAKSAAEQYLDAPDEPAATVKESSTVQPKPAAQTPVLEKVQNLADAIEELKQQVAANQLAGPEKRPTGPSAAELMQQEAATQPKFQAPEDYAGEPEQTAVRRAGKVATALTDAGLRVGLPATGETAIDRFLNEPRAQRMTPGAAEAGQFTQEAGAGPTPIDAFLNAREQELTQRREGAKAQGDQVPESGKMVSPTETGARTRRGGRGDLQSQGKRGWDLIDEAKSNYKKISWKLIKEANPDWKPVGAAREIFGAEGVPADTAAQALYDARIYRGDPGQVDQFGEAMNAAALKRKGQRQQGARENALLDEMATQHERFANANARATKRTQPVVLDSLNVGDEFTLHQHKLKVTDLTFDEDGNVTGLTLDDGNHYGTQHVNGETLLRMDKGSLKSAADKADFAPKEEAETQKTTKAEEAKPAFSLDAAESVEEQQARMAREAEAQAKKDAQAQMQQAAQKKLTGTSGDLGQGDLLGGGKEDLFAPQAPKPTPTPQPKPFGADNKLVTREKADELIARLRQKLGGGNVMTGADPTIFTDAVQVGVYYIEGGIRAFPEWSGKMREMLGDGILPWLRSVYEGARAFPGAEGYEAELTDAATVKQLSQEYVSSANANLERTGAGERGLAAPDVSPPVQDQVEPQGDGNSGRLVQPGEGVGAEPAAPGDVAGDLPDDAVSGSDSGVSGKRSEAGGTAASDAGARQSRRRRRTDGARASAESRGDCGPADAPKVAPDAPKPEGEPVRSDAERLADQRAADARNLSHVAGDLENIRASLPVLLPPQHEDVLKAERRMFLETATPATGATGETLGDPKRGMLFTNGTGTGKTYTGLGVVKRFLQQGLGDVLVITPNQNVNAAWEKESKAVGVPLTILENTKDGGRGVVVTTYANFAANEALMRRDFHLVVVDESHHVLSNEKGDFTAAIEKFRAVANHSDWNMRNKAEMRVIGPVPSKAQFEGNGAAYRQALEAHSRKSAERADEIDAEFKKLKATNTRALFLSATPFAYHTSLQIGDGFLYSLPREERSGYNVPTGFDRLLAESFGYHMRVGKLNKPGQNVRTDLLEMAFNDALQKKGAISGRIIDVPADYSREFVLVNSELSRRLDDGFSWFGSQEARNQYPGLVKAFYDHWDYNEKAQLLEALKLSESIDRIRQHVDLGRKVILFHSFIKSGVQVHPFQFSTYRGLDLQSKERNRAGHERTLAEEIAEFEQMRPELVNMEMPETGKSLAKLEKAFGKEVRFFNGKVPDKARKQAVADFNTDGSGVNVFVAQIDAAKEGISLHDRTGKHQRVMMMAALPVKPTDAIQAEGRGYRIGVQTNLVNEYLALHSLMERFQFGSRINEKVSTAENLALGSLARNLKERFRTAYLNPTDEAPSAQQGSGGKLADRREDTASDFEKAKTWYWQRQKKNSRNKSAEGTDYFATPEPLGLKMVEWARPRTGDGMLEPSAGHGAIGRFFPDTTQRVYIEPSAQLRSELGVKAGGGRIDGGVFEDFNPVNKCDAIVMNPPFGHGGSTAMEHLGKAAWEHLRDGGRIVALIPEGGMADKAFEKFMADPRSKDLYVRRTYGLPTTVFERAGTSVKTRIVILDKNTAGGLEDAGRVDLVGEEGIKEFFDTIEQRDSPERPPKPAAKPAETYSERLDEALQDNDSEPYVIIRRESGVRAKYEAYDRDGKLVSESEKSSGRGSIPEKMNRREGNWRSVSAGGLHFVLQEGEPFTWDWYRQQVADYDAKVAALRADEAKRDAERQKRQTDYERQMEEWRRSGRVRQNEPATAKPEAARATPETMPAVVPVSEQAKSPVPDPAASAGMFKPVDTKHTKTGEPVFVATTTSRMSRDNYEKVLDLAKQEGGYYSSFKGRGAVPGFLFKSADARQRFMSRARMFLGEPEPSTPTPAAGETRYSSGENPTRGLSIAQATATIQQALGVDTLPAGVAVVRDERAGWGARIDNRNRITVNAAQVSSPERLRQVILEEGLHGVWHDPDVQAAWQKFRDAVDSSDLEAEFNRRKAQGLPHDPATLREEAAIARLIKADANKGLLAKLYDAIRDAIKRVFGIELPASDRQKLKDAAIKFLRADQTGGAESRLQPQFAAAEVPPERLPDPAEAQKYRDDFLRWQMGSLKSNQTLDVGRTPEALRAAGVPDGMIYITQQTINDKPTNSRHVYPRHKLSRLPEALANPILVHESWTESDAFLALLDVSHGGENMAAALHFRKTDAGLEVTEIASVYPRNTQQVYEALRRTLTNQRGSVTYYNQQKIRVWLSQHSEFNPPHYWVQQLGRLNIPTEQSLGQGRFAAGDYLVSEEESADLPQGSWQEANQRLQEAQAELEAANRERLDKGRYGQHSRRYENTAQPEGAETVTAARKAAAQRLALATAKYRAARQALRNHPGFAEVAVLGQHNASEEFKRLTGGKLAINPEDYPSPAAVEAAVKPADRARAAELIGQHSDFSATIASMEPKLVDRVTRQLQEAGKLPLPRGLQADVGRTLKGLTAQISALPKDSPKQTIAEKLNLARAVAEKWAAGKTALTRSYAKAQATWQAMVDQWKAGPTTSAKVLRTVPDAQRLVKQWMLWDQETGLDARNYRKALNEKVTNSVRRKAISVWLDAGGDLSLLKFQRDSVPPEYLPIWDAALNLTPGEKALALQVKADWAKKLSDNVAVGFLEPGQELYDYVPQRWKRGYSPKVDADPTAERQKGTPGNPYSRLDNRLPFFHFERVTPSYFEGIMAGGVPENLDIGHLVETYDRAFHKAFSSRATIGKLMAAKMPDGTPVVAHLGVASRDEGGTIFVDSKSGTTPVTADGRPYRSIDHFALRQWLMRQVDNAGKPIIVRGDMVVHPDFYPWLKNELSPSALRDRDTKLGKVLDPVFRSNLYLKSSKLAFATFHLLTIGEHMASHLANPFLNGFKLDLAQPDQRFLVQNGLEIGMGEPRASFEEGLASHGGLMSQIPGLGQVMTRITDWMFKDYIPAIMMKVGVNELSAYRKRYAKELAAGKVTDSQLAEMVASQLNAGGGLMNYRLLGRDRGLHSFSQLLLLAPQFLEARGRVVAQALKPYGYAQRRLLVVQALAMYVGARILNSLFDDDPHWETENMFSVVVNGRAYGIRTIVGDVFHLASDPYSFASGRVSPFARILVETAMQRDLRTGAKKQPPIKTDSKILAGIENAVVDVAQWLAPIGVEGVLPGAAKREQGPVSAALGALGIGSRKYTASTEMSHLAEKFNKSAGGPAGERYEAQHENSAAWGSPYRALDNLLRAGDLDAAQREYDALVKGGAKPKAIADRFSRVNRPFTGSTAREADFKRSLTPEQSRKYQEAIQDRQALQQEFLKLRR